MINHNLFYEILQNCWPVLESKRNAPFIIDCCSERHGFPGVLSWAPLFALLFLRPGWAGFTPKYQTQKVQIIRQTVGRRLSFRLSNHPSPTGTPLILIIPFFRTAVNLSKLAGHSGKFINATRLVEELLLGNWPYFYFRVSLLRHQGGHGNCMSRYCT